MATHLIAFFLKVHQEPSTSIAPFVFIKQGLGPLLKLNLPGTWSMSLPSLVSIVSTSADIQRVTEPLNWKLIG